MAAKFIKVMESDSKIRYVNVDKVRCIALTCYFDSYRVAVEVEGMNVVCSLASGTQKECEERLAQVLKDSGLQFIRTLKAPFTSEVENFINVAKVKAFSVHVHADVSEVIAETDGFHDSRKLFVGSGDECKDFFRKLIERFDVI